MTGRMSRGRAPRTLRSGRPFRPMDWISATTADGAAGTIVANAVTNLYIALPSSLRTLFTDPTIVRIRGSIEIQAQAIGQVQGAVGIIPWPDVNDTPPATGEGPMPWSSPSMEWMWWQHLASPDAVGTVWGRLSGRSGSVGSFGSGGEIDVDVKAMRRMGNDKGLLLSFENVGAVDWTVHFGFRILVKE